MIGRTFDARAFGILLIERLRAGSGRNVALMIGGTGLGQVLILATLPVISRLYLPEDIGRLGLFTSFLNTAAVVTALRYDILIVAAASDEEAAALLAGVCMLSVPLSLLCCGIFAWLIHSGHLGFGALPFDGVLWMFPALVATQLFYTLRYWLMREQAFETIARVTVLHNAGRAIAPIVLSLFGGWAALAASEVTGRCIGIRPMLAPRVRDVREAVRGASRSAIWRAFRKYPESPAAGLPSAVINTASNYLAVPLIASMYGAAAAGYLAMIQSAMQVPVSLISRNIADVFHARLAHHARVTPAAARRLFWRTAGLLLGLSVLPSFLILWIGKPVLALILGRKWATAADLLVALVPWTVAMFVVSPLSRAVVVFRGQGLKLIYDTVSFVGILAVIELARRGAWVIGETVWAISWFQAATYCLYFVTLLRLVPQGGRTVEIGPPPSASR